MKAIILAVTVPLLGAATAAQTLKPAPAPGLWETQYRLLLNGRDMGEAMQAAMAAALKDMPAEHRAMAEQMMKQRGMPGIGGPRQECLTPEAARRRSDGHSMLDDLQKDSPQCRYEPVKIDGGTVRFKGRCSDPKGFTGDIAGEVTMSSDRAWTGHWAGKGRMAGDMGGMPGLSIGPDGQVEMAWNGSGRWLAAACGPVKPQ